MDRKLNFNRMFTSIFGMIHKRCLFACLSFALALTLFTGCSERPLPPEVPYTEEGVSELRDSLGIPEEEESDADSASPESDGDEG